ncbi:translocation and assembly module lipoprotein TamL [Urechidicola sp. KH5]
MKTNCSIRILFLGVFFIILSSCNTIKYVADNEYLLTKNTVTVNSKNKFNNGLKDYVIQRPNRSTLGVPLSLHFYNLGNKDFLNPYEVWKDSLPGREATMVAIFSEKQARAYRRSRYNLNQWFFKKGEAPVILDTIKSRKTALNLQEEFKNRGYFRAKVSYEQEFNDPKKKAQVVYDISTDTIFKIDSVSHYIKSHILDSIFKNDIINSLIKNGEDFNLYTFEDEADRITKLYRNSGVYHFNKSSITFEGDSTSNNYKSDIKMFVNNRIVTKNDTLVTTPYYIQRIKKVNVFTDYTFKDKDRPYSYSNEKDGYTYLSHDLLEYNPKYFNKFLFTEPESVYSDIHTDLTRTNIRRLKNFRLVNIKYEEIDSTNLEANIYLTPLKKYSLALDTELTHSNIKQLGVSGKISLMTRNIFKDASNLQFSVQGSFFNSTDAADTDKSFFNAWEFGGDVSLDIPRILFPVNLEKFISKKMLPQTQFTLGTSFQKNIGLDKQLFTGIMNYNWRSTKTNSHRLDLLNAQFIKNLNVSSYFNIYRSEYNDLVEIADSIDETSPIPPEYYDENGELIPEPFIDYVLEPTNSFENTHPNEFNDTQNIQAQYNIITENVLVPLISYEFTYNNRENFNDANFSFFRARIASAGALTTAFIKKPEDGGKKEVLGIPVAQYIKTDLEYKKFWGRSTDHMLALRTFLGIAIPYGNSDDLPFSRSYFAGGANDIRAWKIYDLGPGGTNTGLEYNVGSMKFLTSFEYRFKLINSFKGALFMDAGNIWDITDSDLIEDEGKFTGLKSLADIAVGTGFGVRYDFNFLVVRLDIGFKTYEPYQPNGSKWFTNYNFGSAVYNIGINYPF